MTVKDVVSKIGESKQKNERRKRMNLKHLCMLILVLAISLVGATSTPANVTGMPRLVANAVNFPTHRNPVMFIENVGQFDSRTRFQVRNGPGTMWLAGDAIWITLVEESPIGELSRSGARRTGVEPGERSRRSVAIKLSFSGSNTATYIEPFSRLDTVVSYFNGNVPKKWIPNVPVWGGVRYKDLYPGIDLELTKGQWKLRITHPEADLNEVHLRVEGADALTSDGSTLHLSTDAGNLTLPLLSVEGRTPLSSAVAFRIDRETFGVASPFFAPSAPSPADTRSSNGFALLYSTFLGGSDKDNGQSLAVDSAGNAYVAGYTYSHDFPVTRGSQNGSYDAFVAKLNASGTALLYTIFLGGSRSDGSYGIAIDGESRAYVTGWTESADFPTTANAFDRSCGTDGDCDYDVIDYYYDAFVAKVSADGTWLDYSTYLGGHSYDEGRAITVDGAGNAYVTGKTGSSDFPTSGGAYDRSHNGNYDTFVVKVDPFGAGLDYATFLGGGNLDWGDGITVDREGHTYVTGLTKSPDFPVTKSFSTSVGDGGDVFVTKLSTTGAAPDYSIALGGGSLDWGFGIAVDNTGHAYVTGETASSTFPTTEGAFDESYNGNCCDVFVTKVNPAGNELVYGTFLGGSSQDWGRAIVVDSTGNAYVTGEVESSNFPTTAGAFDRIHRGYYDVFVSKLSATGAALTYSTFLGGSSSDRGYGIALDGLGNAYVAGYTRSGDFPTTEGSFSTIYNGGSQDAFVTKLTTDGTDGSYTISGTVIDQDDNPLVGVTVSTGSAGYASTNNNGVFTINRLASGTYTLTPSKAGYTFWPSRRTVSVSHDVIGQDFTGTVESAPPASFLLDLPFDYEDSREAFEKALLDTDHEGRVDTWFDHAYPDYGKNKQLVLWDGIVRNKDPYNPELGCYERRCYDGHNGLDFSYVDPQPKVPDSQELPILTVAEGKVVAVKTDCTDWNKGCGSGYGNYVVVDHQNGYFTRYGHLKSVGVVTDTIVAINDTLGVMGSTGNSGGTHLHFSIYRDNGNEHWDGEAVDKTVDPYGWSGEDPDPWVADKQGPTSIYLWKYPYPKERAFIGSQGTEFTDATGNLQVTVPPDTFSGQIILELTTVSGPEPEPPLRSGSPPFKLTLLEWLPGNGALQVAVPFHTTTKGTLTQAITLTVVYTGTNVSHLDASQFSIYHWDEGQDIWQPLPSVVDLANNKVSAQAQQLGSFNLQAPLICPIDGLEPDDRYGAARSVWPNDWPMVRILDISLDRDWVRFDTVQSTTYTIRTQNLAGGADTVLNLYDVNALTLLSSNDNAGGGPASELVWTAPHTGTFFVEVTSALGGATDCSATYELTITTIPGDVVADCRVDISDIQAVASRWRLSANNPDPDNDPTTPNYETRFDLDKNGKVNIVDIMLVVVQWGQVCP